MPFCHAVLSCRFAMQRIALKTSNCDHIIYDLFAPQTQPCVLLFQVLRRSFTAIAKDMARKNEAYMP